MSRNHDSKRIPYVSPSFKVVIYEPEQEIMGFSTTNPDPFADPPQDPFDGGVSVFYQK